MESIIYKLMDRVWKAPPYERLSEEIEHYRELLKPLFSPPQRKRLLRLIDAKDAVREISERDAFARGFRLTNCCCVTLKDGAFASSFILP